MTRWADFVAVKQSVSLGAVLRHYQIPGLLRHGDQLQGCCPIHRGQRDDSSRDSGHEILPQVPRLGSEVM